MDLKKRLLILGGVIALSVLIGVSAYSDYAYKKDNVQAANELSFTDIKETDWFYSDISYVKETGLMQGTGETFFSPNDPTTRGMLVTILWRLDGEPVEHGNAFSDVTEDAYYHDPVVWASKYGIVNGYSDTSFSPNDNITREQLATILYRYSEFKGNDVSKISEMTEYTDKNQISDYAFSAMGWANANGIITGVSHDTINPKGYATRCQIAAILKRVCENILNIEDDNSEEKSDSEKEGGVETNNPSENSYEDTSSSDKTPSFGGDPATDGENDRIDEEPVKVQPIITVNPAYGKPGEIVEVNLDLEQNPGILGMVLSLEYDETAMKLLNVKNGEAVSDVLTLTQSKTLNSGVRFVWDGLHLNETDNQNGTLLTLEFEILDSATAGKSYPLKFSYNTGDIVDSELKEVNPMIQQGYLEIEETVE